MDPSATSGLNVTVVGMGVVFTALMMIVAVVVHISILLTIATVSDFSA